MSLNTSGSATDLDLQTLSPELYSSFSKYRLNLFLNTDPALSFDQFKIIFRKNREWADGRIVIIDQALDQEYDLLKAIKNKLRAEFSGYTERREIANILSNLDGINSLADITSTIYKNLWRPLVVILKNPPSMSQSFVEEILECNLPLKVLAYFDKDHILDYVKFGKLSRDLWAVGEVIYELK